MNSELITKLVIYLGFALWIETRILVDFSWEREDKTICNPLDQDLYIT